MSATLRIATAVKTVRATALWQRLNGGSILLYAGSVPADADTAITDQTLLATFDALNTPAGSVTDGVFTLDTTGGIITLAVTTATATFARALDSTSGVIADMDVGESGSGALLIIDDAAIVTGMLVSITSLVVTEG